MEARHPHASWMALRSGKFGAFRRDLGLGKDFIAVFDVAPDAHPFGRLVAMLPVGNAMTAHHTNYAMPPNDVLYANDWVGNRTYVFNLRDPLHPRLLRQFSSVGVYGWPHSFVYLSTATRLPPFSTPGV